jgi:hypothetical protein
MDEDPTKFDGTIRDDPNLSSDPVNLSVSLTPPETVTPIEPNFRESNKSSLRSGGADNPSMADGCCPVACEIPVEFKEEDTEKCWVRDRSAYCTMILLISCSAGLKHDSKVYLAAHNSLIIPA